MYEKVGKISINMFYQGNKFPFADWTFFGLTLRTYISSIDATMNNHLEEVSMFSVTVGLCEVKVTNNCG